MHRDKLSEKKIYIQDGRQSEGDVSLNILISIPKNIDSKTKIDFFTQYFCFMYFMLNWLLTLTLNYA